MSANIPLPPLPDCARLAMLDAARAYFAGFTESCTGTTDAWQAAANDIAILPALDISDLAAKLMVGLHYLHPAPDEGDAHMLDDDFAIDGARDILLSCVNDAIRIAANSNAAVRS